MLRPVESSVFPSCFGALAWSPDGELAVAGGDQIYILTPNFETAASAPQGNEQWNTTRVRVNAFTNAEWAPIFPQNRDDFSLAAEQSNSTVLGLAWSPPGLARFRRSVLAVLTSNLILSLWEPMGLKRQWTRVGIVNHALHSDPSNPTQETGLALRRVNIRSFRWCLPLKVPSTSKSSASIHDPESRWGTHLLTVATDANEIVLVRVRRSTGAETSRKAYRIDKIALHSLVAEGDHYPAVQSGSLLQDRLQLQARISSLSCGPWITALNYQDGGAHTITTVVAAVYGTRLQFVRISFAFPHSNSVKDGAIQHEPTAEMREHPLASSAPRWAQHHIKAPLEWFYTNKTETVALAAGINGGLLTISVPRSAYDGQWVEGNEVQIREWPLFEPGIGVGEIPKRHWDPITDMIASADKDSDVCRLHLGTIGGLSGAIRLDQLETNDDPQTPAWNHFIGDRQEQYDLDRDLGGQSLSRIWGLASYRGVNAVLFTNHPTDMIEYRVASDERATIAFAADDAERTLDMQTLFAPQLGTQGPRSVQEHREAATSYVLSGNREIDIYEGSQKFIYAAACCAIIDGHSKPIRSQARQILEHLAALTVADLDEEISKCSTDNATLSAKPTGQLDGPGGHMFERCEICDAGIAWFAPTEAQCANGHLFARCGLTFLAIQEPGISKYCSLCRTEYIDEELVRRMPDGHLPQIFQELCDAFDTCLYCGGKFQAHL